MKTNDHPKIAVYILAKNEEANIARCLSSLKDATWPVYVLDSGSSDSTINIVDSFSFAKLVNYSYKNHCDSYNEVTKILALQYDYVLVLDADMIISKPLRIEIEQNIKKIAADDVDAVKATVEMWIEGHRLKHTSLYPPKPFLLKTGEAHFESIGHGEKLRNELKVAKLNNKLIHDDRKSFGTFLQSQVRYATNLSMRSQSGLVNTRDKLRLRTPLMIAVTPIYSYFKKLGFMDGRIGLLYALDRLIAEAIMFRTSLSQALKGSDIQKRK